jgi:hypothetical protein
MGLPRSTFYDAPAKKTDDGEIVVRITAICEEFECYGYRGYVPRSGVARRWGAARERALM